MMKNTTILFIIVCIFPLAIKAQEIIQLYTGAIPNSKQIAIKDNGTNSADGIIRKSVVPTLELYLPEKEKSTGAAVIICPGGTYTVLVYQGEGVTTAKEFAKNGVTAFVLKYRLPDDSTMQDKTIGPLQDAQQAIKLVRENAAKWGINPNKIGIMGFSAGGHLAASLATHFKKALIPNENNTSLRPDFQVLVYPVISMQDSVTHIASRSKLLGKNPTKEVIDEFSSELLVEKNSPPAYIIHAGDDKLVDVDNSINYFEKLRHNNVEVEMQIYPRGGHGFVFRQSGWMLPLFLWMKNSKWINN